MQMVEFLFDTCATLNVLPSLVDDEVLARVASLLIATCGNAFAAGRDQVGLYYRRTNKNTQREQENE